MRVNWANVLLEAVNFLVLVWILRHFLYGPIQHVLGERKAQVEKDLAQAAAERERATVERRDAAQTAAIAAKEADKALEAAHAHARVEEARLEAEARKKAEEILANGRKCLEEERGEAAKKLEEAASRLSVSLTERLLQELDPAPIARLLLDRALAGLEALEPARLDALRHEISRGGVKVVTSAPLEASERAKAAKRLADRLAVSPEHVAFVVEPALGGAEIRFPATAVAFTWQGALARLMQESSFDGAQGKHEHAR